MVGNARSLGDTERSSSAPNVAHLLTQSVHLYNPSSHLNNALLATIASHQEYEVRYSSSNWQPLLPSNWKP